MPEDLRGRRALVTGATGAIGGAIAAGLARAGAAVIVNGRDPQRVARAVELLGEDVAAGGGPPAEGVVFDVGDRTGTTEALARLQADLGGVDVLVNNAGMQVRTPMLDLPEGAWDDVLETNLTACFLLARALAPGMLARGHGKIINIASLQTRASRATTTPYAVSKAGLAALTRSMCAEWGPGGVQANALAPGYVATPLNTVLSDDPEFTAWVHSRTPAGRWGRPEDLVGPAVWLASAASDFVNGQVVYVDGGFTAVL